MCDKDICPHEETGKPCPLDNLDAAEKSEAGQLIRRATDLKAVLQLGVHIPLEDIAADELLAMLVIEEEINRRDDERNKQS